MESRFHPIFLSCHPHVSPHKPTRYDLAIRFPHAVFWSPSALWLPGELAVEPEALWIAIDSKARPPRTLDPPTVILRLRHHKRDAKLFRLPGRAITLLVHSLERARADASSRWCSRGAFPSPRPRWLLPEQRRPTK